MSWGNLMNLKKGSFGSLGGICRTQGLYVLKKSRVIWVLFNSSYFQLWRHPYVLDIWWRLPHIEWMIMILQGVLHWLNIFKGMRELLITHYQRCLEYHCAIVLDILFALLFRIKSTYRSIKANLFVLQLLCSFLILPLSSSAHRRCCLGSLLF